MATRRSDDYLLKKGADVDAISIPHYISPLRASEYDHEAAAKLLFFEYVLSPIATLAVLRKSGNRR